MLRKFFLVFLRRIQISWTRVDLARRGRETAEEKPGVLPVAGEKPFRLLQLDSKTLVHDAPGGCPRVPPGLGLQLEKPGVMQVAA